MMTRSRTFRSLTLSAAMVLGLALPVLAGPPLLCFPFDIGTARSLPWQGGAGWRNMQPGYDTARLADDTLALLTPETPVLVRMETLRRATAYATLDARAGRTLLERLDARMNAAGPDRHARALALFDAGYLVEAFRQARPVSVTTADVVGARRGYPLVAESLALTGDDPAMAFAAALMTDGGSASPTQRAHAQRARSGVTRDAMLARNISHLN